MSISIIIPTFNRPDFLLEAVESIWNQTILPDEIIIGDDSLNDLTEKLVKQKIMVQSKVPVRYYHNHPPLRQAENVNFLIRKATSDYLLLLHDDDALLPECLQLLLPPLIENPWVVSSFGKQYVMDDSGQLIPGDEKIINENTCRTAKYSGVVDGEWAAVIGMFPNNAFLIRTELAQEVGYNDNGRSGDAIDFFFGFRVGKGNKFFFVNEFTSKYRHTLECVSRGSLKLFSSKLQILMEDLERKKMANDEVKKTINFLFNPAITEAIKRGDRKMAVKWMFSAQYNLFTLKGCKRIAMLVNPFY